MQPEDLNVALIYILRVLYPLTLLILWRLWLPGVAFGGYLAAATIWTWIYSPDTLWRVILPSALTSPLEILATWETCRRFLDDDWEDHKGSIMRVIWAMGAVGAAVALGLHAPDGIWKIHTLFRACVHIGCLSMLITAGSYAGFERMRVHRLYWTHAMVWTAYVSANVVGVIMRARIPHTEEGGVLWFDAQNGILIFMAGCLAIWCVKAFTVPRAAP